MLVKNGVEGILHFMNHPEILPYVGFEKMLEQAQKIIKKYPANKLVKKISYC